MYYAYDSSRRFLSLFPLLSLIYLVLCLLLLDSCLSASVSSCLVFDMDDVHVTAPTCFSLSLDSNECRYGFIPFNLFSKARIGLSGKLRPTRDPCCFPSNLADCRTLVELMMPTKSAPKAPKAPKTPKTPTRGRQAKAQEPLTPSLTNALNNLNLRSASPIKRATQIGGDISLNPFLEHQVPIGQSLRNNALFGGGGGGKSRPSSRPGSRAGSRPGSRPGSPTKQQRSRSASRGRTKNVVVICGMEQRLDIVRMDYPGKVLSHSQKSAEEPAPKPNGKKPRRTKSWSGLVRCVSRVDFINLFI